MVRTKADAGSSKVSVSKAPRKILGSSGGGASGSSSSPARSSGSAKDRFSGGNSYNPQPTPNWQKGINSFFKSAPESSDKEKNKENLCSSDDAELMECPEKSPAHEHSSETPASSKKSSGKAPSKSPSEDSMEVSEDKSFTKNGVISDDDDDD